MLSFVSKKYPRAVLVHKDRLLCCKVDEVDLCTYKWMKKLDAITRLRRIPKPTYAVTNSAEVAIEFDEVDPETGMLFEEILSFAREVDAERLIRDIEDGRKAARKARMDAAAAREAAANSSAAAASTPSPSSPPKTPQKPIASATPVPSQAPTFDAFGGALSPPAQAFFSAPLPSPAASRPAPPNFDAFGDLANAVAPAAAPPNFDAFGGFTSAAAPPLPTPAACRPAPPDFDGFGDLVSSPPAAATPINTAPAAAAMSDLFGNFGTTPAAAPPPPRAPTNLLDDVPVGPLNSLAPQLGAALPGAGWPSASPVKLSRDGPRLGEDVRKGKPDPFASLLDL